MNFYSILIAVHNERNSIPSLLNGLKSYAETGHEVLIINDGSIDGTVELLQKCNFIHLINLDINQGKGVALRKGLLSAKYEKVIIFDGDLELDPLEIKKLMILDKKKKVNSVMGYRFDSLNPLKSNFDWGNFMFTSFFNIIFSTHHKDVLCCAKSFYFDKNLLRIITSQEFEIDVELTSIITINNKNYNISQVFFNYKRRTIEEGKKLKVSDGWSILYKIISMLRFK